MKTLRRVLLIVVLSGLQVADASGQQQQQTEIPDNPLVALRVGQDQTKALKVNDAIFQAIGFSNTFLVVTSEGNVVIDTSMPFNAARHRQLLRAENSGPVKYIILTHAHGDHTGGVPVWREPDTRIVAQREHADFQHYQARLNSFFAARNAAQFALNIPQPAAWPGNYGATIAPTVLFDDRYEFELGGLKFEVIHTPGETYDHATVWIPQYRAAFVGDNFYASFPNIYTLRGTQPRWALDYIKSLDRVLALKPEILLPSHGVPVHGSAEITRQVVRYRDAIQYVHDETVKGMNAGKDVFTLMRDIRLPAALDVGESYGKLSWSVRGIYEGYVGWFDLNPATMYETPASAVYPDLVRMAGGPEKVAALAMEKAEVVPVEALHLADAALSADAGHKGALRARLRALEVLRDRCRNSNERGWLEFSIRQTRQRLGE
ncbi:MAG: MBL fold metallo-hydrolase [Blastocatellales bacterium]|nr:MBL fold metallo-hydrolase [Blastocatellales bacterium]